MTSRDDIRAAAELLGIKPTMEALRAVWAPQGMHEKMRGLPGADKCPHKFVGSGAVYRGSEFESAFKDAYYKHHEYVIDINHPDFMHGAEWCKCGNGPSSNLHQTCEEE